MFAALQARYGSSGADGVQLFTCTVGRKPSCAQFYLPDYERVLELLSSMRMQSAGKARFHSVAGGLASMALDGGGGGGGGFGGGLSGSVSGNHVGGFGGGGGGRALAGLAGVSEGSGADGAGEGGASARQGALGRSRKNT